MKIFVPFDFGRTLETGMGTVMSLSLIHIFGRRTNDE